MMDRPIRDRQLQKLLEETRKVLLRSQEVIRQSDRLVRQTRELMRDVDLLRDEWASNANVDTLKSRVSHLAPLIKK